MMDLFGDIPVTEQDVELWLDSVPNLSSASYRREAYRKAYRVEEKIRAAKRSGRWPLVSAKQAPAPHGAR